MTEETVIHHILVPKHEKISKNEKNALFERYSISVQDLPKISISDPAITDMALVPGDIIKITRKSQTAGEVIFYRGVSSE